MIFMTPLTLYLAIFDPVSDCGCFGDAWVLTNWETFAKNIVLLLAAIATFQWRKMLIRFVTRKMEWLISLYTIFFVFTLSFYCLDRLPVLDFRPYKIGQNIMKGMSIPEGAKPSVYESVFILEKNGEKKEFTTRQLSGQHMDLCRYAYHSERKRIRAFDPRLLHDGYEHG